MPHAEIVLNIYISFYIY